MAFTARLTLLLTTATCLLLLLPGIFANSADEMTTTQKHEGEPYAVNPHSTIDPWPPASAIDQPAIQVLFREYDFIFRHGNRNAASHLWSTFLLERAPQMSVERLQFFFTGFCAVSGSPVRPSDYNRFRLTLPLVTHESHAQQQKVTGFMHYCCWPCVCDTQDFIRVDTLTVTSHDGTPRQHYFTVIGNPCDHPEQLEEPFEQPFQYSRGRPTTLLTAAPELKCLEGGILKGASLSDHGYIIIGMFFDAVPASSLLMEDANALESWEVPNQVPGRISTTKVTIGATATIGDKEGSNSEPFKSILYQDERDWENQCVDRAESGYNSGMGEIFRRVSAISPIRTSYDPALKALPDSSINHSDGDPVETALDAQPESLQQQSSTEDISCVIPMADSTEAAKV